MNQSDSSCIFCQIASNQAPCFKIYEDQQFLAFLDIFPNTEGFTVVIPKQHAASDFAVVNSELIQSLMIVCQATAQKIAQAYDDVERCALVFEGTEINHLHAKIMPLHYTKESASSNQQVVDINQTYFEVYPGYITSRKPKTMADVEHLRTVAQKINSESPLKSNTDS